MEIVLGLLAVLVVSGLVAAFIAARPRRRHTELEPPSASPVPPPAAAPPAPVKPPKAKRPSIPSEEELARQAAEVVAEAEAVLAGARESPIEPAQPGGVEAPPTPRPPARLGKARGLLDGYLGVVRARTQIDDDSWDELEEAL